MSRTLLATQWSKRLIGLGVALVVVVFVLLNTKFVSSATSAKNQPAAFSATAFAQDKWPGLVDKIESRAIDVTTLAPAVDKGLAAAGKKYGQDLGAGSYAFPVKATGTVTSVDASFITLDVPGMPKTDAVRVPLGLALNGSAIRDATGTIHYGDFTDQTDYQDVSNALQALSKKNVLAKIDVAGLNGKKITVFGGFESGGPPNSFAIAPVKIEVGS